MRRWIGALILTLSALSACSSDVTVAEHDELGDIVAGHITVPYAFVKAVADELNQPVERIWHLMYMGYFENPIAPRAGPRATDLRLGFKLLEEAGIEIPGELLTEGLVAADGGHQCTLLLFDGDWEDEEAVDDWREHHLNPWGECVNDILESGECESLEDFKTSRSEDDDGNKYYHVLCEGEPD